MKLVFTYDKSGRVASYSNGLNTVENFKQLELDVTDVELQNLKKGYKSWIKDNKLVLEETENLAKQRVKEQIKEKLKDSTIQFKDVADLLLQIL